MRDSLNPECPENGTRPNAALRTTLTGVTQDTNNAIGNHDDSLSLNLRPHTMAASLEP